MEYNDTILTFDTLYTTNEIQLLKLALPLLSNQLQPIAATLIKMRELEYCLSRLPHTKIQDFSIAVDRLDTFFDSAMPFCNQQQKKLFSQLRQMKQSMKMMEKIQTILQMLPPDAMPFDGNGNSTDPDALSHMFEVFSAMQHMSGAASDSVFSESFTSTTAANSSDSVVSTAASESTDPDASTAASESTDPDASTAASESGNSDVSTADSKSGNSAISGQKTASDGNSVMESILGSMLSPAQKESYQRFKEAFSSDDKQNVDDRPASASD